MDKTEIKFLCYFAYLGPFWLIGLIGGGRVSRKFRFHANQGIALFILEIAAVLIVLLLDSIAGGTVSLAATLAALGIFVWLSVRGMMNVSAGRKDDITFLGRIEFLPIYDRRQ